MRKPATLLLVATSLLVACERYTEQTSPCFGRNGKPVISRAAHSFVIAPISKAAPSKDCVFETLGRPE